MMKAAFKSFIERFMGEKVSLEEEQTFFPDIPQMNDLLPYQAFHDDLYYLKGGLGICLESPPYVGTGFEQKTADSLRHFLKSFLPEGASLEFLLVATPLIQKTLSAFEERKAKLAFHQNLFLEMARRRTAFMKEKALAGKSRDFLTILSLRIDGELDDEDIKQKLLRAKRELLAIMPEAIPLKPQKLQSIINLFFSPNDDKEVSETASSFPDMGRLLTPYIRREVKKDGMLLEGKEKEWVKVLEVTEWPERWESLLSSCLIGSAINPYSQIESPFAIHLGLAILPYKRALELKGRRVIHDAKGPLATLLPSIKDEAGDWMRYFAEKEKGEKPLFLSMALILKDTKERVEKGVSKARSIFGEQGLRLRESKFVVLTRLLATLPMSWGKETKQMLNQFKMGRMTLTSEAASLAPLFGEWKGTKTPSLLFTGRRGQMMTWSPFDSDTNFNVAIAGASGSGKSVLMQEIITQHLSEGARVVVLDVGGSYRKLADLLGGMFIEFDPDHPRSMNPFQEIEGKGEDAVQALSMVSDLVAKMAFPKDDVDGETVQFIARACHDVFEVKGKQATIADIALWFEQNKTHNQHLSKSIAMRLYPYSEEGAYRRFFRQQSEISLNHDFVCLELESLKNVYPDLQPVVLQMMILKIAKDLYLGDRKRATLVVIDEAWDLLGSTGQGGSFIETAARRFRKYRGSLIVGTQGIGDFFQPRAGEAAFTNSAWKLILAQDRQAIEDLVCKKRLGEIGEQKGLFESIHTEKGNYSEVAIVKDGNIVVGRLMLDPYAGALYSTTAEEYAALNEKRASGMPLEQALKSLIGETS